MSNEKALSLNQDSYVIGLKQTTKALLKHDVRQVIIAQDINNVLLSSFLNSTHPGGSF